MDWYSPACTHADLDFLGWAVLLPPEWVRGAEKRLIYRIQSLLKVQNCETGPLLPIHSIFRIAH